MPHSLILPYCKIVYQSKFPTHMQGQLRVEYIMIIQPGWNQGIANSGKVPLRQARTQLVSWGHQHHLGTALDLGAFIPKLLTCIFRGSISTAMTHLSRQSLVIQQHLCFARIKFQFAFPPPERQAFRPSVASLGQEEKRKQSCMSCA